MNKLKTLVSGLVVGLAFYVGGCTHRNNFRVESRQMAEVSAGYSVEKVERVSENRLPFLYERLLEYADSNGDGVLDDREWRMMITAMGLKGRIDSTRRVVEGEPTLENVTTALGYYAGED